MTPSEEFVNVMVHVIMPLTAFLVLVLEGILRCLGVYHRSPLSVCGRGIMSLGEWCCLTVRGQWRRLPKRHQPVAVLVLTVGLALLIPPHAFAQIGQGSTRVPLTDWLIEFYNVTNNVYAPLIALAAIVGTAWAILGGHVRIGPTMGRLILVIMVLGLGVAWILQQMGANAAIAMLG